MINNKYIFLYNLIVYLNLQMNEKDKRMQQFNLY